MESGIEPAGEVVGRILQMFTPPPRLTTSEWADRYRVLAPESSSKPGRWHTSRAIYLREPMDVFENEPWVNDVTCVFARQLGKTEIVLNRLGKKIHLSPGPSLVLLPTVEMADAWSEDRLSPMIRESSELATLVRKSARRTQRNTKRHKKFTTGAVVNLAGANSPASLCMRAIRDLFCDETDRYPASAGTEGDPIAIAKGSLSTFHDAEIFKISSPTDEDTSRIWLSFSETDQRKCFVPCPFCKEKQILEWKNVQWKERDYSNVVYVCPHCKGEITEGYKPEMLEGHEWRKTAKAPKNKVGFWLSALYSPWVSWATLAQEYDEAKRTRKAHLMKVFVNTRLAEVWRENLETFDSHNLYMRRESYKATVPKDVLVLTCGADVQDDRIECEVVGWGEDDESWGIDYRVFWGDPAEKKVWEEFDAYLLGKFPHERGSEMEIACACVDSRGHHNGKVWSFCERRKARNVFAIHGVGGENVALVGAPKRARRGRNRRKALVFPVGTYEAKTAIYSYLKLTTPGPSFCHFPVKDCYTDDYFKQLTSEQKITVYKHGYPTKEWILPEGRRNEALDCRVYALAALHILKPNYELMRRRFLREEEEARRYRNPVDVDRSDEGGSRDEEARCEETTRRRQKRGRNTFV